MNALKRNNVHVVGRGQPTLLFVNGFGCDQTIWRYLLPALSEHYSLVLFDHMGAGLSDATAYNPSKYASLHGYAQDVLEICEELKLREVTLVGHSVGAMIGALAAISAPERFRRLLLLCPSPCYLNEADYHGGFDRADIENMLSFMERDFSEWADSFVPLIMGNPDRPSLSDELILSFCRNDLTIARQFARVTFLSDNRSDLARLRTPCLLLQCAEDLIAPLDVGTYLHASLPGSTLVTLPVNGHCPHVSAPRETLAAMEAYMGV